MKPADFFLPGEGRDEVLYGTSDGKIGLVQLTRYFVKEIIEIMN